MPQPVQIVIKVKFFPKSKEEAELVATDIANAVEEVLRQYGFESSGFSFETCEVESKPEKSDLDLDLDRGFLKRIRPYPKTALYLSKYCNASTVPLQARWLVLKYVGRGSHYGIFTENLDEEGVPALILDDYSSKFWPVVSFLTGREVEVLRRKLEVL